MTRAEKRSDMQYRILKMAMAHVVGDGVDKLTMNGLAKDLEISVGGLYRYFPTKAEIVVELERIAIQSYGRYLDGRLAKINESFSDKGGPALALLRLLTVGHAYLDHAHHDKATHALIDQVLSTPSVLLDEKQSAQVENALRPVLARCAGLFDLAVDEGALGKGDSLTRTYVLWTALHGIDHFRKRDRLVGPSHRADAIAAASLDVMMLGWEAPRRALDQARRMLSSGK